MPKTLILYYSETGNTEKIARVIAKALAADLKRIEDFDVRKITDYDLIFIGTPVHYLSSAPKVKEFLSALPFLPGKKAAAFCTMHINGDREVFSEIKEIFKNKKIDFLGGFSCLGKSRLVANFGPRVFNRNRPNKKDIEKAEKWAKKILEIAKR